MARYDLHPKRAREAATCGTAGSLCRGLRRCARRVLGPPRDRGLRTGLPQSEHDHLLRLPPGLETVGPGRALRMRRGKSFRAGHTPPAVWVPSLPLDGPRFSHRGAGRAHLHHRRPGQRGLGARHRRGARPRYVPAVRDAQGLVGCARSRARRARRPSGTTPGGAPRRRGPGASRELAEAPQVSRVDRLDGCLEVERGGVGRAHRSRIRSTVVTARSGTKRTPDVRVRARPPGQGRPAGGLRAFRERGTGFATLDPRSMTARKNTTIGGLG